MADKSQEQALALLKDAKEKGTLDPSVEAELAELIGSSSRPKVKDVLEVEKRELTPEQTDSLVSTLKSRFELPNNKELHEAIDFADAEKSLRANPEALFQLQKLEETGGEPQIVGMEGDAYIIEDRSSESPSGRRNLNFDEADAQRTSFGQDVGFQNSTSYKAMQKTGKYDQNSVSWLETNDKTREAGGALSGLRRFDGDLYLCIDNAGYHHPDRGWRASLRVKKV